MRKWLVDRWKVIAGTVTFLAALMTVIVCGNTLRAWVFANEEEIVKCNYYDGAYRWPAAYAGSDEKVKRCFETFQSFFRIHLQNRTKAELVHLTVSLPVESIIEAETKGVVRSYGVGERFGIGNVAVGESVTIYVWCKRPFVSTDAVTIAHEGASVALKPGVLISQEDFDDLKTGHQVYRAATVLASVAIVILAVWLVISRRAAKSQAKPRRPRKKKADAAPQPPPGQEQAGQSSAA